MDHQLKKPIAGTSMGESGENWTMPTAGKFTRPQFYAGCASVRSRGDEASKFQRPAGNLSIKQFSIENGPVEMVSFPIHSMVDLSSSFSLHVDQRVEDLHRLTIFHQACQGF